jgi:hypothetical protein
MELTERIKTFSALGEYLRSALNVNSGKHFERLNLLIVNQYLHNPWFTPENVRTAVRSIAEELTEENLVKWTSNYPQIKDEIKPILVAVIMAGNIPLVGFHDFISVLISGNNILAKTSSKDSDLIIYIADILCGINPGFRKRIEFTAGTLNGFDAVIATGSNNSSRYFEYYFGKYPNIIRKNRNSIAILEGDESAAELEALGTDIFSYFGLGCRNVSKIYIPENYDITSLAKRWESYSGCINNQKYANNYDFNKAVFLVNKETFYDTGFLLMKEDSNFASPVSVLHYEKYKSQNVVKHQTELLEEEIQCIVSRKNIPFGKAQTPHLWEYADGIDTIEFLLKKKIAGIL